MGAFPAFQDTHPYFQRAYELGDHDPQTVYLMEMSRKFTMSYEGPFTERRENWKPNEDLFRDFGTSAIWGEDDEECHDAPSSDEFIQAFQNMTGFKLPRLHMSN